MDNQAQQDYCRTEDDEFPEEFQCCVCLDIMYKPVVLACGHISCFWCVFKAMNFDQESHCPVCRQPYNHFPRICELMHFLLVMLYPSAYKRRGRQIAEEEKERGQTSPQFDDKLIGSPFEEIRDTQHNSSKLLEAVPNNSNAARVVDHSFFEDSSENTSHNKDNIISIPKASSSQETNCVVEDSKQDLLIHLQCAVCKQLLCRPVVLNCGHVYCEACISPHDNACKCPKCRSAHPNGFPNVCLVLEHFLEYHFPVEYSTRKESLSNFQNGNSSQGSRGKQEQAAQSSSVPKYMDSAFSGHGLKFHRGVGCDYCGMCPIIGNRYRCKDCIEKIGFDLCENCYNSSSKLPGRFNQQHTQDHQFQVIQAINSRHIILSLRAEHSEIDDESRVVDPDSSVVITGSYLSNDASEDELEIISSVNTLDSDSRDFEDAVASPNSLRDRSQDQLSDSAI